jgi:hypothetical protein
MEILVLIEPVPGNGFRAGVGEPLALTAQGATRDEALQKLNALLQARVAAGAEIVALQVSVKEQVSVKDNPWVAMAGMFKDNPLFDEVVEIMAEQRRQADEDPDYL